MVQTQLVRFIADLLYNLLNNKSKCIQQICNIWPCSGTGIVEWEKLSYKRATTNHPEHTHTHNRFTALCVFLQLFLHQYT